MHTGLVDIHGSGTMLLMAVLVKKTKTLEDWQVGSRNTQIEKSTYK